MYLQGSSEADFENDVKPVLFQRLKAYIFNTTSREKF